MNKLYKYLTPFAGILGRYPHIVLALRYRLAMGRRLERKKPVLWTDKVFWESCNTDTSLWSLLADKYLVRDWVKQRCSDDILTKLYAVYDSADEIDFSELPDSFVIKTNNGCASNFLVRNKNETNLEEIRKKLSYWLHFPYGELTGQTHYSRITPKIIVEELLIQDNNPEAALVDYKFYCFNGEPKYCLVISDRVFGTHKYSRMIYDMEWRAFPEYFEEGAELKAAIQPEPFTKMREIAKTLSLGFKYVRVDMYCIRGRILFGEMTFMPGMETKFTKEFQLELGNLMEN